MADLDAYPAALKVLAASATREWIDDVVIDRSVSGAGKARSFFTAKKSRFMLPHLLTLTEYGTLQTLYDANRNLRVTLTWIPDGLPYICFFDGPPSRPTFVTPTLVRVDVRLVEQ
jgi:hypothetical protein